MSGKCGLIVGSRGTGKSFIAKSMVRRVNEKARLIYDVNAEYKDLYQYPFLDFDKFTDIMTRTRDAFILIEESTIFLSNRGNNFDIRSTLVKARHNNTTVFFVFHSLRSVPRYVFDLCDVLILLKTSDDVETVAQKFDNPAVTRAVEKIRDADWLTNSEGRKYSPSLIVPLMD